MSKYLKNDAVKQVARNLIMNAAQREKAKAGRVTMPKVFLVVGSVEFAVMIALTFFSLLSAHLPAFAVIFGVFSLAGLALVIVYFNQRIYYTNEMLVYKNFFGIKRACRYDELTGIVIEKDVKLFAGEKKFNIDSMAVGRKEFLRCAEARDITVPIKRISRSSRDRKMIYSRETLRTPNNLYAAILL